MAALTGGLLSLGGCGIADVQFDAPVLDAVGINLNSKKADDADVPERPALVLPPSTDRLPAPGERTAAQQNWPQDPDQLKKQKQAKAAEDREKYCVEGQWKKKGDIDEFNKDTGVTPRCPSKLGETVNKAIANSDTPNR
jgi:hypothetical protein